MKEGQRRRPQRPLTHYHLHGSRHWRLQGLGGRGLGLNREELTPFLQQLLNSRLRVAKTYTSQRSTKPVWTQNYCNTTEQAILTCTKFLAFMLYNPAWIEEMRCQKYLKLVPGMPWLVCWARRRCRRVSWRTGGCCRTSTLAHTMLSPCTKNDRLNDRCVLQEHVSITHYSCYIWFTSI